MPKNLAHSRMDGRFFVDLSALEKPIICLLVAFVSGAGEDPV